MAGSDNNDDNDSSTEKEREEKKAKQNPNLVSKGYPGTGGKIRPKEKFL